MSTSRLQIEHFLWFMHGTSHPVMAQANDGNHYIVKLSGHGAAGALAFNEAAGTELFAAGGLNTAPWATVEISRELIDRACSRWPEMAIDLAGVEPGLYFGSRYLGVPGWRLFTTVPGAELTKLQNRLEFWAAWLLDVCAEQTRPRQAVFVQDSIGHLEAVFTDHSGLLRGPDRKEHADFEAVKYPDDLIYVPLHPAEVAGIARSLNRIDANALRHRVHSFPEVWKDAASLAAFDDCLEHIANFALLEQVMQTIDHIHRTSPRMLLSRLTAHAEATIGHYC